ncbi:tetratricopeptide repeat protein [Anaerolineales bacterium HSG6]|nr:tetratricopeptide repeat protein [Anaerolineales bacterium HSG6]
MKYRFITILIVLLITGTACGFGGDEPTEEPQAPPPTEAPAEVEPTDTPEPELSAEELYGQGEAAYDAGNFSEAIELFDQAIELDDEFANAYNNRGLSYYELGESNQALADFNQAIKLAGDDSTPYNNRGIVYDDLGNYDQALTDYDQAIALDDSDPLFYNNRGVTHGNLGDYESALADFNVSLELDDAYALAYSNRGEIYYNLDDHVSALADYDTAIELDPELKRAYNDRGFIYYLLDEYDLALADFEQALEIDPEYVSAYYQRGLLYSTMEEYDLALADLDQAIELDPESAEVYYYRGFTYYQQDDYEKAIADFDEAIVRNELYDAAYYYRGLTHQHLENHEAAVVDLSQSIELDSSYADTYYYRGLSYASLADSASARSDFETVIELSDNSDLQAIAEAELLALGADSGEGWEEMVSQDGGFSVMIPPGGEPIEELQADGMSLFGSDFGESAYIVMYSPLPTGASEVDPEELLDSSQESIFNDPDNELVSTESVTLGDYVGRRVIFTGDSDGEPMRFSSQMYIIGDKLYQIMLVTPEADDNPANIMRYWESFQLLAGETTVEDSDSSSLPSSSNWETFISPEGSFSVDMPSTPTEQDLGGSIMYMSEPEAGMAYAVGYIDLPSDSFSDTEIDAILENTEEGFLGDKELVSSEKIDLDGYAGREIVVVGPSGTDNTLTYSLRLYIVGDKLYQLLVTAIDEKQPEVELERFWNSFILLDASSAAPSENAAPEPASGSGDIAQIGDGVPVADLVVTVNRVEEIDGSDFIQPEDGNIYLAVEVTVANTGAEEEIIASIISMSLTDGAGNIYEESLMASVVISDNGNDFVAEIPAGGSNTGMVGFEIPATATELTFMFDEDPFLDHNIISISLGR